METETQNATHTTINLKIPTTSTIASKRSLIPVSYAIVILSFFFTFCDFKCADQKLGSITGFELVKGTELKGRSSFGQESQNEEIPPSIWAVIAFSTASIGLLTFIKKWRKEAVIGTAVGIMGFISLIILQYNIKNSVQEKGNIQLEVIFKFGYWLALICMALGGFLSFLRTKLKPDNNIS